MMTPQEIRNSLAYTIDQARLVAPLAPSITNTVTIDFVANAQLAVGGSAAMVYMADEAQALAAVCGGFYINMGTIFPFYPETLLAAAKALNEYNKPWIIDPVGIGIGSIRMDILAKFKEYKPTIIRGNASEIISVAKLWELIESTSSEGPRGVDSVDTVAQAKEAAIAIARYTGGAVAVSGVEDLLTDGHQVIYARGGSHYMEKITGAGCTLAGVCAVYAAVASPLMAVLAGTFIYNYAGQESEKIAQGPGSFKVEFIDKLYQAKGSEVAKLDFEVKAV